MWCPEFRASPWSRTLLTCEWAAAPRWGPMGALDGILWPQVCLFGQLHIHTTRRITSGCDAHSSVEGHHNYHEAGLSQAWERPGGVACSRVPKDPGPLPTERAFFFERNTRSYDA